MITSLYQLDLNARYNYADYLKWQLEEYVDLIRGRYSGGLYFRVFIKILVGIVSYIINKLIGLFTASNSHW